MTIRRVSRGDAAELIAGHVRSLDLHLPWMEPFTDMAGFEPWYERIVTGQMVGFVATELEAGAIGGVVSLSGIAYGPVRNAYLGYYAMAGSERRGLMSAAVAAAVRFAFAELGLHRVEANIQPGNAPSLALARRLGFRWEGFSPRYLRIAGQWRDHERWALLADDPGPFQTISAPSPFDHVSPA